MPASFAAARPSCTSRTPIPMFAFCRLPWKSVPVIPRSWSAAAPVTAPAAVAAKVEAPPPPADTTGPNVSEATVPAGSTLNRVVALTATATDAGGIAEVRFIVDGTVIGTDTTIPYSFDWDTSTVADGTYTLTYSVYLGFLQLQRQRQTPSLSSQDFEAYVEHVIATLIPAD